MDYLCIGLNQRTAPVEVREKFAVAPARLAEVGRRLRDESQVAEVVVVSTCNRTEYYFATGGEGTAGRVFNWLRGESGLAEDELGHIFRHDGEDAARHLCRVVGGLDSMVLGETEVFGQVKQAYQSALEAGLTGGLLNRLFQRAFGVGKRLRSQTSIQSGATSVGSVAVELAEKIFGHLRDSTVMVLGAGEMSRVTAQSLLSRGAHSVIVSNRSYDRAASLADELGGRAVQFDAWVDELKNIDVVISATGAPHAVMRYDQIFSVRKERKFRPLFLIDIAVPRDIEASVAEIDGVYLYDIDTLQQIAGQARERRQEQVKACEKIIVEEMQGWKPPKGGPKKESGGQRPFRVGTRGSALALAQATTTEGVLQAVLPGILLERRVIKTTGDRRTDVSLKDLAQADGDIDKGVFIKELESALADGEIDVAVHSLKDLPTELDPAFELAAVLPRAPVADVLVTRAPGGLAGLADGVEVGTSSVRRAKQLEWLRPGLRAVDIRGNVPTRLSKLAAGEYDAILLAEAGLRRLGHDLSAPLSVDGVDLHVEVLDEEEFLPAAGQGAIGLEIRRGDDVASDLAKMVNDAQTWLRVRAEREFLHLLGAGCHTPVGVRSVIRCGKLTLEGRVFPEEGGEPRHGRVEGDAEEPEDLARKLMDTLE